MITKYAKQHKQHSICSGRAYPSCELQEVTSSELLFVIYLYYILRAEGKRTKLTVQKQQLKQGNENKAEIGGHVHLTITGRPDWAREINQMLEHNRTRLGTEKVDEKHEQQNRTTTKQQNYANGLGNLALEEFRELATQASTSTV